MILARSWLRRRRGRRVIVHTTLDQSVEGLLVTVAPDGLILQGVRFLASDTAAAGELFVPKDRVGFVQYQGPA